MSANKTFAEVVRSRAHALEESGGAAIAGLFDITADRLVRFAISITGNQHDAEDAVQSTMVKVAAKPKCLASAQQPWAYLLTMVRHESLAIAGRSKRFPLLRSLADLVTRLPVDHLQRQETYDEVWRSLRRLPPDQAEVVVLKIWEGMTLAEIAVITDQSPDTVASRYRYAMEKLRRMLGPSLHRAHADKSSMKLIASHFDSFSIRGQR